MAYLDNTTITVDAILTKKGRELFAKSSQNFKITKFALSDDEVDYRLYDKTHPSGSAYYANAIESLPILEALPDDSKMLKYKLISLPKNTTTGYVVTVATNTYSSFWARDLNVKSKHLGSTADITPQTSAGADDQAGYTAILYDNRYLTLSVTESAVNTASQPEIVKDAGQYSVTKIGKKFRIVAKELPANTNIMGPITLRITGNASGQSTTITFTVKRYSVYGDVQTAS